MIRSFYAFIFLFLSQITINAQVPENGVGSKNGDERIRYGIRVGYTSSHLDQTLFELQELKNVGGFYIGAFAQIPLVENTLYLQPEIDYTKIGNRLEMEGIGYSQMRINNINVPVLLKYKFYKGANVHMGPELNILTDSHLDYDWGRHFDGAGSESYNKVVKRFNYSAVFGVGYQFPIGLSLDARYTVGLSKIMHPEEAKARKEAVTDFRTRVISFGVGYYF
ncbi:porin family protein [Ornithobacterium rhinotracheale]|uniref:porin family protein n=1 Tax=Ornithobacterium rhinotracheale TaxID=28251 RepID=UPI002158B002|nr:porin family protein [Ornithobacterium rhinotracheale]UVD86833.1 PorT family protein [Ornithobacterium rhinotracheale]